MKADEPLRSKCRGLWKSSTRRMRQLERGESARRKQSTPCSAEEGEELALREARRVKAALKMGRLITIKTLAGFDFAFQPSLDRNRILALAQLKFIGMRSSISLASPAAVRRIWR